MTEHDDARAIIEGLRSVVGDAVDDFAARLARRYPDADIQVEEPKMTRTHWRTTTDEQNRVTGCELVMSNPDWQALREALPQEVADAIETRVTPDGEVEAEMTTATYRRVDPVIRERLRVAELADDLPAYDGDWAQRGSGLDLTAWAVFRSGVPYRGR